MRSTNATDPEVSHRPNGNSRVLRFDGATGAFIDRFVTNKSGDLESPTWLLFVP